MSIKVDNELREGVEVALAEGKKVLPDMLYFFQMACFLFFMIAPAMVGWKMSELSAKANGSFDIWAFFAWAAIVTAAEMALVQGGRVLSEYANHGNPLFKYPAKSFLGICVVAMIVCATLSSTSGIIRYALYMDSTTNKQAQAQIELLQRQMQVHIDYVDRRTADGLVSGGKTDAAMKDINRLRAKIEKLQSGDVSPITAGQNAIAGFWNEHFGGKANSDRGVTREDVTLMMFTFFAITCALASLTFSYVSENTTCNWAIQRAANKRMSTLHDQSFKNQKRSIEIQNKQATSDFLTGLKRRFMTPDSEEAAPSQRRRGGGNSAGVSTTRIKNKALKLLDENPNLQVKTAVRRANAALSEGAQIDAKRRDKIAADISESLGKN